MMKIYSVFKRFCLCLFLLAFTQSKINAQCACTAIQFTINLTAAVNIQSIQVGPVRSGTSCCTNTTASQDCIKFIVLLNAGSDLLNFDVTNPGPPGGAFYQVNCGPQISLNTPCCVSGQTQVCVTFCKSGGDSPNYVFTASKTFSASPDFSVRVGCSKTMTVVGLSAASVSWTSISPGAIGQYTPYLSCANGCTATVVTPTAPTPTLIAYKVSGSPATACPGTYADTVLVSVLPGLTVNITPTNAVVCSGGTGSVVLTASVSGGALPYTYTWSNGPNTSTDNVPVGNYTVLVNDNTSGCAAIAQTVAVTPITTPSAPTLGNNSPLCIGATLSLTATNSGGTIWNWTGPNGFVSSLQNPTLSPATLAASGTYSASMTFSGCTGPIGTTNVTVSPIPSAPVAGSNSTLCAGSTLSLTATFSAGATYSWTGPNGFTANVQNPTIPLATTSASGTYSVSLIIGGCQGPIGTVNVTVNPIPAAPTAANNSSICAGQTLSLTANPGGAIYSWLGPNVFSSALQNPTISPATTLASGTYSVTQTLLGCTGPAGITNVTVNPIPAAPTAANNSSICAGQTLSLTANPGGAIYSWNGPNGFSSALQNPTISPATTLASGTYSVTQTLLGCTGPAGITNVTVNPIPAAPAAANNSSICAGQTLSLTANPGGAIYDWSGPNTFTSNLQNPTIAPASTLASGTYSVTQTLLGCTGPAGITNVTVNPIPAAPTAANNSSICAGQTLSLTANPGGAIYNWNGPNSFTSTAQNPTISPATTLASGTYSVTQTLLGCTGPAGITNVTVNPIPAAPAAANNSSICAGQTLSLTANPGGAIYSWNGPNGFSSALQNPTISPATTLASGTYSVTQTLLGCTGPAGITNVTVNPIPAAPTAANNSSICAGQTLSLTANPGGAIYSWLGPNGFSSALQNPTISPATTLASGTYSVTQTLLGCTGPAGITNVTVNPIPAAPAAANNSSICAGQTLSLTANPGGAIYNWNGPNSFTSTAQNPTISPATTLASGTYSVTQTLLGCTGPAGITNVTVNPIPAAPTAANNSSICAGQTLSLTANPGGAIYSWNGPNGFSSALQNPTISPATTLASGTYSVTQTLLGCTGPAGITNVTVNPIPAAPTAANNSSICAGQTLSLTANPGGAIYNWNGPNSFTSTAQNPTISPATTLASGTYSVTQTLLGCTGPAGITNVTVNPIPAAPTAANNSSICAGQTLSLTANPGGAIYDWSGPNTFTSNLQNPTIAPASTLASGTYSVTQTLLGCTGPAGITTVTVNPVPDMPLAGSNSSICAGQTLSLTSTFSAGATYSWTGPNTFTSNLQNPTIAPATTLASGTYSVFLDIGGCSGPIGTVNVTVNPIPAAPVAANNSTLCEGATLNLTANPGGAVYDWSGPNTFTSNLQNPTIVGATTLATGMYSVTQTLLGCTSPAGTTSVTIVPIPSAPLAGSNSSLCAGSTLSLTASFTAGAVYNWSGPNTFTSNVQNPTISPVTTSASGVYTVFVGLAGCTGPTVTINVLINPVPAAPTAANNSSICEGSTLNFTANPGGAVYNWTGPNGFTSNLQNPSIPNASTLAIGDYSVTQTLLGCTSTEGITSVTINPIPAAPTGSSNLVCGNGALVFTISPGGGVYSWLGPLSFTSALQNPTISPAPVGATGNYSVTISLLGCTSPPGIVSASVGIIPNAPGIGANSPLCIGSTLSLTASFTNGVVYTWTGPNSYTAVGQNPLVVGVSTLATGVYTVSGSINGCNGPDTTISVVVQVPAFVDAGNRQDTICATAGFIPLTGTVTGGGSTGGVWNSLGSGSFSPSNSLVTTYSMSNGDMTSPFFDLILTSQGGSCPNQNDTIRFIVLGAPFVDVGTDLNICKNAFVPFSATITGVTNTGTWTANGATGSFTPGFNSLNGFYIPSSADTAAGSIKLTLTTTNNHGCLSTKDSLLVTFITAPHANFINTNACTSQSLTFTDLSTPSASLGTFNWNFGDGTGTSTSANPTYTYAASNTYTVSHIATLTNGCKDTIRKVVTVYNSPLADFTFSNVCVGNQSSFFDASSVTPDTLVSWNWTFGDGNSATAVNPLNLYTNTGTFAVNFTVTSSKGCPAYAIKTVTVHPRPKADFSMSATYVLAYDDVAFTDLSTPAPSISSWSWNFGNTNTSATQNPDNVFTDKGIYPVKLAVRDNFGCADTISKDIYVTLLPLVPTAFTPNSDGFNDILFVKGGPFIKMSFRVYNSWGELIFTSDDQEKGWDGKYKGQPAPLGVYVWILDVDLYNGKSVRKTGDVTILK